ncbi:MAG: DoxX family protein [Myxococcota bacterium]
MAQNTDSKVLRYGSILIGLAFIMSGGMKLTGPDEMVANFARWGYPDFFIYMIGAFELAGGIGLMLPSLAGLAATGLVIIMTGAVFTHVRAGEFAQIPPSAILLTVSALIARARRSPVFVKLGLAKAA